MSMWKKLLAVALTASISAGAAVAGTVAYLQDTESDVNVMTLGNVSITQNEYQRVEKDGEFSAEVEPFQQGKPMYPVTDRKGTNDELTIGEHTIERTDSWNNYIDKMVTVKNTGKSDAYVRTLVAMPSGGSEWESDYGINDYGKKWLALTTNKVTRDTWFWHMQNSEPDPLGDRDTVTADAYKPVLAEINGKNYYVWEFTYKTAIEPGYETYPNLLGVRMHSKVDADDAGYYMDENSNGKYDTGDKRIEGVTVGGAVDVLVLSQAVQTAGFADPQTALDTAFGDVTKENAAAWFGGVLTIGGADSNIEFEEAPANAVKVEGTNKDAVLDAINNARPGDVIALTEDTTIAGYDAGKKLIIDKAIVLDLNGYTLTTESGWGGIDLKGGASIVNGTINHTGNTAAIKAFQVDKIENVVINLTETAGKVKGGIVVQEGAGCYVGSIKNVTIKGATNGIETHRCGDRTDLAIGSMENVTIEALDTGILLSAPIGKVENCTIKGDKIGINAYLYGAYSVTAELIDCVVEGADADIYAHDEVGETNPGSMNLTYGSAMALDLNVVQEFEAEVADRVFVGIK